MEVCSSCGSKFSFHVYPRILQCLHLCCGKCVTKAFCENGGIVRCALSGCNRETVVEDLSRDSPIDKRTLGSSLAFKENKTTTAVKSPLHHIQDSDVDFAPSTTSSDSPLMCLRHNQPVTKISLAEVRSGCGLCFADASPDSGQQESLFSLGSVNKELQKVGFSEKVYQTLEAHNHQLKFWKTVLDKKKGDKALLENLFKVKDHFDGIHRAMELKEAQISNQIMKRREQLLQLNHDITNSRLMMRKLEEEFHQAQAPGSSGIDVLSIVNRIAEEAAKIERLKQAFEDATVPVSITTDNKSFLQVLDSSITIEDPQFMTPPESEDDKFDILSVETCDSDSSLLVSAKNHIRNNLDHASPSPSHTEDSSTTRSKVKMLKQVKLSKKRILTKGEAINNIIDIVSDVSDAGSDSNIEEIKYKDHIDSFNTANIKPRTRVDMLNIVDPGEIWLRRSEDEMIFHNLTYNLARFYNTNSRKHDLVDWEVGKFGVLKMKGVGWVRAQILEIKEKEVEILMVDVGAQMVADLEDLLPLAEEFANTPCLSFPVTIADIHPIGDGPKWSYHAVNFVKEMKLEATHSEVEVLDASGDRPSVKLWLMFEVNDDPLSPSEIKEECLGNLLCQEGLGMKPTIINKAMSIIVTRPSINKVAKWPERALPLVQVFDCTVQWVDWTCTFHVTLTDWEGERRRLECEVGAAFFRSGSSSHCKDDAWRPGQAVMAQYPRDESWHRAEVLCVLEGDMIKVRYVDYGEEREVSVSSLSSRLTATDIPVLVIPVQLDIRPREGKEWSRDILDQIHQMIEGKKITAEIKHYGNPFPLIVEMRLEDGLNFGDFLVSGDYVKKGFRER